MLYTEVQEFSCLQELAFKNVNGLHYRSQTLDTHFRPSESESIFHVKDQNTGFRLVVKSRDTSRIHFVSDWFAAHRIVVRMISRPRVPRACVHTCVARAHENQIWSARFTQISAVTRSLYTARSIR